MEGGCQCGRLRYRLSGDPRHVVVCHCRECQRQSGSAFGMSLVVPSHAFELLSGTPKRFTMQTDSGRTKHGAFCPDCGVRIYHQVEGVAALSIKAGTLDDTRVLSPQAHYWTKRKQPWVVIPPGVRRVEDDG